MTNNHIILMAFILGVIAGSAITAVAIASRPQDGPTSSQIMQLIPAWCGKDGCL